MSSNKYIKVSDGTYPLTYSQIKAIHSEVLFPRNPKDSDLLAMGYALVNDTERPIADVVTEGEPELRDGKYYRTWQAREFNEQELEAQLNDRKEELRDLINKNTEQALKQGVLYDFGGDAGELHIQVRDGDRANLAGLRINAERMIREESDELTPFRTYENVTVLLSPEEVVIMTDAALVGYYGILEQAWVLKDQIKEATSLEELPEV